MFTHVQEHVGFQKILLNTNYTLIINVFDVVKITIQRTIYNKDVKLNFNIINHGFYFGSKVIILIFKCEIKHMS